MIPAKGNEMTTLLIKNIHTLVTMDETRREIANGGIFIKDGFIQHIGKMENCRSRQIKCLICTITSYSGLINTHHHFYQTLTRAVTAAQDANLFNWLKTLYPIWARMTSQDIYLSTKTALAELACPVAPLHRIIYIFSPTMPVWMMRSARPLKWACASMPHADR
jgi:cytosine/adenosine deaminase-related metal-dependent hydrolase